MNSAARILNQSTISRTWVVSILLTRAQYGLFTLAVGVLLSALSVVYVTNVTRTLNATMQQTLQERNHLHILWGQLLLEKSSLMTQARIQDVASNKLDMIIPEDRSVVIIKSDK